MVQRQDADTLNSQEGIIGDSVFFPDYCTPDGHIPVVRMGVLQKPSDLRPGLHFIYSVHHSGNLLPDSLLMPAKSR